MLFLDVVQKRYCYLLCRLLLTTVMVTEREIPARQWTRTPSCRSRAPSNRNRNKITLQVSQLGIRLVRLHLSQSMCLVGLWTLSSFKITSASYYLRHTTLRLVIEYWSLQHPIAREKKRNPREKKLVAMGTATEQERDLAALFLSSPSCLFLFAYKKALNISQHGCNKSQPLYWLFNWRRSR